MKRNHQSLLSRKLIRILLLIMMFANLDGWTQNAVTFGRGHYRFFRNDLLGLFGANSNLSEVFYANIITILAVLDIKGVVGVMCEFEIFVCKSRSFNDLVILVVFARLWRLN